MKLLSEKKKVYLFLLEIIFSFVTVVIAAAFINIAETDFLASNIAYQTIGFILISFIYFIATTINKEFKLASVFKISQTAINFFLKVALACFPQILIINPTLIKIFEFIIPILEIPFAYFFCKGFYELVSQKTKNIILANKWKKILTANVILAILNFISHIINFFEIASITPVLLFALVVAIYSICIGILKVIYILKTAQGLT